MYSQILRRVISAEVKTEVATFDFDIKVLIVFAFIVGMPKDQFL